MNYFTRTKKKKFNIQHDNLLINVTSEKKVIIQAYTIAKTSRQVMKFELFWLGVSAIYDYASFQTEKDVITLYVGKLIDQNETYNKTLFDFENIIIPKGLFIHQTTTKGLSLNDYKSVKRNKFHLVDKNGYLSLIYLKELPLKHVELIMKTLLKYSIVMIAIDREKQLHISLKIANKEYEAFVEETLKIREFFEEIQLIKIGALDTTTINRQLVMSQMGIHTPLDFDALGFLKLIIDEIEPHNEYIQLEKLNELIKNMKSSKQAEFINKGIILVENIDSKNDFIMKRKGVFFENAGFILSNYLNEYKKAKIFFEKALKQYQKINFYDGIVNSNAFLIHAEYMLKDYIAVINTGGKALRVIEKDDHRLADIYNNIGIAYLELGDKDNAVALLNRALQIASDNENKTLEGMIYGNLIRTLDANILSGEIIEYYQNFVDRQEGDLDYYQNMRQILEDLLTLRETIPHSEVRRYLDQIHKLDKKFQNKILNEVSTQLVQE